jgi:hypothetical protein
MFPDGTLCINSKLVYIALYQTWCVTWLSATFHIALPDHSSGKMLFLRGTWDTVFASKFPELADRFPSFVFVFLVLSRSDCLLL